MAETEARARHDAEPPIRAVAITASTRLAHEPDGDRGGDAVVELLEAVGAEITGREVLADSREVIANRLRHWADSAACDLIVTCGGTGFASSDVTPEATADVIERPAPGIAEAMRAASAPHTKHWMLSRATAGIRAGTLIVNLPGNPKAVGETGDAIASALPHAVALLRGEPVAH